MHAPLRRHALKHQCLSFLSFFLLSLLLINCNLQLRIEPKEATIAFLPLPGITVKIGKTNASA